ncbi:hypothetical protein SRHO_G00106310 [Serrasalmus rhombeus]
MEAVAAEGRLYTQPATLLSHDRVFRAPMLCVIGPCYNALRGCAGPDPPPITPFDSPHSTVPPCQLQNHLLSIRRRRKSLIISTNPFKRKTRFR